MTTTQVRRIDEVAAVFNGKTPSKSEQRGSGHPVLKIKDVDALGKFRGTFSWHVGADLAQKHVKQQLAGGETLVLNAAHSVTHVASKTFYADQEVAGSLATGEWLIIRWCTESVDSRFGNHWINAPDTRFRIRRLVNGIHLYPKDVARLQIPLPPLDEQKRIAGILDAADALRAKRREALAELDTLLQSTFLDMFGDPVTNPMGWERKPLGEIIKVRSGDGLISKDMAPDGKYPVYGGNGISGYHDSFMFEEPRIVLGRVGVYCGAVHLTRPRAWVTDNALYVHTFIQPVDTTYLVAALKMANLNQYAGRSAQPLISGNRIYPVEILIPSVDRQHRFAAIVESVEEQKTRQRAHLAELDTLFASLQSRAFRGDL